MSHFDIRNRDMGKKISFKYLWMKDQLQKIRLKYSEDDLSNQEIFDYLNKKYSERFQPEGRFMSNTTFSNRKMKLEQFIDYYINSDYIISGYNTLFENHKTNNIAANALKYFLDQRKVYKKKMTEYPKGSTKYLYYKVMQLTYKILANSYYGILGLNVSPFYNSFIQNSVTLSGQDIITTAISAVEGILGDNNKFKNLADIIEFINNIKTDHYEHDILDYVSKPVTADTLVDYLAQHLKPEAEPINDEYLRAVVEKLTDEERTRVYYKNHLTELLLEEKFVDLTKRYLFDEKYCGKYGDPDKHVNIEFRTLVCDFVFYDHILDDRYKRFLKDKRNSSIVTDTDSTFCYMQRQVDAISAAFNLEQTKPNVLNIDNLVIDVITEALKRICWVLTRNMGIEDDYKEIINFKNEFVYEKLITTKNKKHYAGILVAELGNLITDKNGVELPAEDRLDIKGLPIRKSVVPKDLREEFTQFLLNDILNTNVINFQTLIEHYDNIVNKVEASLRNGESTYLIPANLEILENYAYPDRMQQVRGMIVWNELEPENQIQPPEKVNIIKLKTGIAPVRTSKDTEETYKEKLNAAINNCPELMEMKEKYPDKFKTIMRVVYNYGLTDDQVSKKINFADKGFNVIAVPKDLDRIPDYILPLVDYDEMIKTNTSAGNTLLGALGIYVDKENNKTNIVKI